jgi:glycosyltransferase involved in cell wall biosynthesis
MRIAIIGTRGYPYVYSGYETFVTELCQRLVKKDIQVTVYCHKNLFTDRPKQVNGIDLVYMPTIEKKAFSQLVHSLLSMTHACFSKADIILAVNPANGPYGLIAKICRKPSIINVDGLEWLRPKWKGLGGKYFYFAAWLSTKLYDRLVNDSEEMKKVYLELFNKDSTVIAYGANIKTSTQPELIKKWNLTPNNYYLIVGRLIPDNNADLIINGFIKSKTNKKLVVVGDVPFEDDYARNIKQVKDSRIILTGYVTNGDELAELYHNCYAYFHGHEFGGTNPTMLKALAYGCAILALNTRFNQEMLDKGKYGLYFAKQPEAVTTLVNNIDDKETELIKLREISRNRIIENYTWEKITQQYIDLFNTMLPVSKKIL